MNAHIIESELQTTKLEFNGKVYEVEASLSVLRKIQNLDENTDEFDSVQKIIAWLVNDAIARDNLLNGTHDKLIPLEYFDLLIGRSNLSYYEEVVNKVIDSGSVEETPELDDDGNETVVTDEMIEEFGEPIKNAKTE
jgi:hypothetical protein|nr:MAG TPA: hypothetical protein [Caudoviricetes sp.]